MLRISKETRLTPAQVLKQAVNSFGKDGLGLDEKERNACCLYFEGVGGYVSINIVNKDKKRTVEITSREWDYHAKRFLKNL